MDKTDYKQYIEDSYNWARYNGFCKTKLEFAKILGVHPATLSTKDNRYSGRNTAMKIEIWRKSVTQEIASKTKDEFDWDVYRREVAMRMLPITSQWKLTKQSKKDSIPVFIGIPMEASVKIAIKYANELIKQLKECSQ